MHFLKKITSLVVLTLISSGFLWAAKPFKKVLVISGGGINPGLAVGIIAGVQAQGWFPDLIIATCGSGIGAAMNHSEVTIDGTLKKLRSQEFFDALNLVKIQTSSALDMLKKLDETKDTTRYPHIFENVLLYGPENFPKIINNVDFSINSNKTKLIIISGRALFGPQDAGYQRRNEPLFQQVYFTDPQTAKLIEGWRLPPQFSFPNTTVSPLTLALSNSDTISAMRAGIADPYLINPNKIENYYHFSGAIDNYPIDLAVALGEEVVATYPAALFLDYEDSIFNMAFGFKQTSKALEAIQHKDVKWIDISGLDDLSFNPKVGFISFENKIPSNFKSFVGAVSAQWNFGFDRGGEAIKVAPGSTLDIRTHLRKPINPKLREEFSCSNANEWNTDQQKNCTSDKSPGCSRKEASSCTPIR